MATHSRKTPADENIRLRVELRMRRKGWNAAEMARQLGIKPATVSHWLAGRFQPSQAALHRLAALFDVTSDWLMGRNLTDAQKADEARMMRLLLSLPDELLTLAESLGPERLAEAIRREAARQPKKR
jgi:transcriptional regulator with XRE-family HTH domain